MLKVINSLKASVNDTFSAFAITCKWLQDRVIAFTFFFIYVIRINKLSVFFS